MLLWELTWGRSPSVPEVASSLSRERAKPKEFRVVRHILRCRSSCTLDEVEVYPESEMKIFRHFGVFLLLLLSCAAPLMACVIPEAEMTAQERTCCRMMHNQCDQMRMPDSQNCCAKVPSSVFENALKSDSVRFHAVAAIVIRVSSCDLLTRESVSPAWLQRPEHSPPKPPPTAITILRI